MRIVFITTSFGKRRADTRSASKRPPAAPSRSYQRLPPAFDASHVLSPQVPTASQGRRALRWPTTALANFIMTVVRDRAQASQGSLHCPLAGGRKDHDVLHRLRHEACLARARQPGASCAGERGLRKTSPASGSPPRMRRTRHITSRDTTWTPAWRRSRWCPSPGATADLPWWCCRKPARRSTCATGAADRPGENPSAAPEVDLPAACVRLSTVDSDLYLVFAPKLLEMGVLHPHGALHRGRRERPDPPAQGQPGNRPVRPLLQELLPLCVFGLQRPPDNLAALRTGTLPAGSLDSTLEALRNGILIPGLTSKTSSSRYSCSSYPPVRHRWVQPGQLFGTKTASVWGREAIDKTPKRRLRPAPEPHQIHRGQCPSVDVAPACPHGIGNRTSTFNSASRNTDKG